ncbi:hypothetical protein HMPREF1544_06982 [Mucor circinelloides 1006PhL]|uniref:Uncharacterized protein n=1 Tax=Mucor circinelloides f. circinelloides (strain 1006PhL) TaxID=1220926 RepID=S2J9C8_MUCC1|nr:hypothetical protein HMPREF1544_06982 [Mucor circinelloides 1006PhL]KAG1115395.1 hypothetical protein G6F42_013947 [Rhizopus arrhizus]
MASGFKHFAVVVVDPVPNLVKLWTHVVCNNKKGKQKQQQQNVSFNPTLTTPPVSTTDSSQNVSAANPTPALIAMIRPFMNGLEENSDFIDLATVKKLICTKIFLATAKNPDNTSAITSWKLCGFLML